MRYFLTLFVRKYLLLFLKIKFLIQSFKKKLIVFNELNQIKQFVAKIAIFNTFLYEIKLRKYLYIFSFAKWRKSSCTQELHPHPGQCNELRF